MEKQMCRKCGEHEAYSAECPFCANCWNHLDSSNPKERSWIVYYGNKMYYAEHPEVAKAVKEQRKQWQKNYIANNREKWNAYQRAYAKRKREEAKRIKAELEELKAEKERLKQIAEKFKG